MTADSGVVGRRLIVVLGNQLVRPLLVLRRGILKVLTGRSRSPKQDGPQFGQTSGAVRE